MNRPSGPGPGPGYGPGPGNVPVPGPRRQPSDPGPTCLDVRALTLRFGGLTSLDGVNLRQRAGTVLAVIGPNGAGKTSLFNCLTGVYRPQAGTATFTPTGGSGVELLRRSAHAVCRLGVARTFQHARLFPTMSAFDNVRVGVEAASPGLGAASALLPTRRLRRRTAAVERRCWELLDEVGLAGRAASPAGGLPYGEQRRLEIARALGTGPSLLLLDEPAAGATAAERAGLVELVRRIASGGTSVLLIEHDVPLVMSVATDVVVLDFGQVLAAGTPTEVRQNPAVVAAYLGGPQ